MSRPPFRAPLRGLVLLALAAALVLPASASASALTTTFTFPAQDASQTFTVPPGVTSLRVVAIGGRGGSGRPDGPANGGFGAEVSGTLAVTPGDRLYVEVGGNGGPGTGCVGGAGGFNGGGTSPVSECGFARVGGGGGGGSDVRTCAPDAGACTGTADPLGRLLVAGGGGGAGRFFNDVSGDGGDATHDGDSADVEVASKGPAGGGGAGTASAGGAAGVSGDAASGTHQPKAATGGALAVGGLGGYTQDGIAAQTSGGGGGGGRYGGGGGGSANYYAGGGGGGSNLVPDGGTASTDATGTPQITITFDVGAPASLSKPAFENDVNTLVANGVATTSVTTALADETGAPITGQAVTFSASGTGAPTIGATTDNGDGTYSATVTTSSTAGTSAIAAHLASPALSSEPATFTQIGLPVVTSPATDTPFVDGSEGGPSVVFTASGTADAHTTSVSLKCASPYFGLIPLAGDASDIPVTAGMWTAPGLQLPGDSYPGDGQCPLVAIPNGATDADVSGASGPVLRRLRYEADFDDDDNVVGYNVTGSGTDGNVAVTPFGREDDCGLAMDSGLLFDNRWLDCGGGPSGPNEWTDDGPNRPSVTVDGHRAYTPAQWHDEASDDLASAPDAPHVSDFSATAGAGGTFVVTERDATARCTGSSSVPDDDDCGAVADTGVALVVTTTINATGKHVERRVRLESTDAQAHEVQISYGLRTGAEEPELRLGDETTYAAHDDPADGPAAPAGPYSVLVRDGDVHEVPTLIQTSSGAPVSQAFTGDGDLIQRFTRTVPASGAAPELGQTFDVVDDADASTTAATARAAYRPHVTITAPVTGSTTGEHVVTVTGTTADQSGAVTLTIAGQPVTVAEDGGWSSPVQLNEGANTIPVVVTNRFGVTDAASIDVTYVPDTTTTPTDTTTTDTTTTDTTTTDTTTPDVTPTVDTPAPDPGTTPTTPTTPDTRPTPTPTPTPKPTVATLGKLSKSIDLSKAAKQGVSIPLTIGVAKSTVTARLKGSWGTLAKVSRSKLKAGRLTLRLKPSKSAVKNAEKALKKHRKVTVKLTITVKPPSGSGAAKTFHATVRLVR